jgi:hypothetical protein
MVSRQLSFLNIRFVVKKATLQSKMCKISEIKAIIQSAEAKTLKIRPDLAGDPLRIPKLFIGIFIFT